MVGIFDSFSFGFVTFVHRITDRQHNKKNCSIQKKHQKKITYDDWTTSKNLFKCTKNIFFVLNCLQNEQSTSTTNWMQLKKRRKKPSNNWEMIAINFKVCECIKDLMCGILRFFENGCSSLKIRWMSSWMMMLLFPLADFHDCFFSLKWFGSFLY